MRKWQRVDHAVTKGDDFSAKFAASQKERETDANLEKDHSGVSREMRRNMELG
jgi:hypothetical protein